MNELIQGGLVAVGGILSVWITARVTMRGHKDTRDISWFDRLTARVDAQDKRIEELTEELEVVKLDRFALRALVQAFVEHVQQWRRQTPAEQWPEAPREVAERMGDDL